MTIELLAAGRSDFIRADFAVARGDSPLRADPAGFQHALQRRIQRAFLDLQQIFGGALDELCEGITVQGRTAESLENHHLQGSGKEITLFDGSIRYHTCSL